MSDNILLHSKAIDGSDDKYLHEAVNKKVVWDKKCTERRTVKAAKETAQGEEAHSTRRSNRKRTSSTADVESKESLYLMQDIEDGKEKKKKKGSNKK